MDAFLPIITLLLKWRYNWFSNRKYSRYYAGGPISYKETDVNPLVAFLLEGIIHRYHFRIQTKLLGAEARWKQY